YYGLQFTVGDDDKPAGDAELESEDEPDSHLGIDTRVDNGRLKVTKVTRGGPAWRAGVQAADEILAVDDRRVPADGLRAVLSRYQPGARVTLLVARWNLVRRIQVVLGRAPVSAFDLELAGDASAAQRARLAAWLAPAR
ncbi:MAG TPA: PDZ domain-containing protein, partial [Kofleriaceae bacterium]|nr:PDZ domain-containing protein [Kofleriaceae bacterium]